MKVHLMFPDKDFDAESKPCYGKEILISDLGLEQILSTMAQGDEIIYKVCSTAFFNPLSCKEEILYRQENLKDALKNSDSVRELYRITVETEQRRRESWYWLGSVYLSAVYSNAVGLLKIYIDMLMRLRKIADSTIQTFQSDGFRNLLTMIQKELDDDYFHKVRSLLDELSEEGILVSAKLGNYLQGVQYVMRRKKKDRGYLLKWMFAPSYTIAPRDDAGAMDLEKRRARAINQPANALAQAAEHLQAFFNVLRHELAFYVGCLNIADKLKALNMPICFPEILPMDSWDRSWKGLYDVGLALVKNSKVVGNDFEARNKKLYIISGANQGGKTTFLRSIGQAQLMAQCGMFVGAESFAVPIRKGIYTHFKKEEDRTMKSGRLDEELSRMNEIANRIEPFSVVLFNESFLATNEREGSEICRQITKALIDNDVEAFSVTLLYPFVKAFIDDESAQFLMAERLDSGERTFRMISGKPAETAHGMNLYRKIFSSKVLINSR
ncbi:MutS-related protein [Pseudothermotoga thermarum]|uniref:DNA mismatch repair protein MutS domain protein n=1 Tax=Pseudothermotoga thermarum DSM 5069 TaxID=688269 RepID=F7YWZ5_9THEM|nr:DNA mismatch repair protein MutS [Pseudothermotoga thermarum]AEH50587.1 DNA mismatch repair protein MutS domain protein [Pseudothermotoga thermarum DSM 5069]